MIDTDKYEGHTPGPWYLVGQHCDDVGQELFWVHADDYICDITETNNHIAEVWSLVKADAQLMTDAPLLLAEVNRLLDYIQEYEEVTEPILLDVIKGLKKRIEDMQKGAPRCSCPRISVNGNGGGGSIMVDVTFEDGEEYSGCLDRGEE